jgi:hypothetical protein
MIDPGLGIRLFGFAGTITGPGHHDLRRAREGQESFPAANANRLKIRNLLRFI